MPLAYLPPKYSQPCSSDIGPTHSQLERDRGIVEHSIEMLSQYLPEQESPVMIWLLAHSRYWVGSSEKLLLQFRLETAKLVLVQ